MRHSKQIIGFVAAAVALAACSGASTATDASPTTTLAPSTAAPTTTAPTTAPAATIPLPTTMVAAATTTAPPPTSDEAIKAAVIAGYELYSIGVVACAAEPANCEPNDYTVPDSVASQMLRQFAAELASKGHVGVPAPTVNRFEILDFRNAPVGDAYQITVCQIDGTVVRDSAGTVVDDKVYAVRSSWTTTPYGAAWRVASGALESSVEGTQCD